ncbi:MAG: Glu-tRNA(Gln) amidotransferase subunit GatD [Nanoarchaeota archaeon]|nr:Glu-tRNA(Gln) amidotransferase subunit GatD [Nanoarchaeota archaeon]
MEAKPGDRVSIRTVHETLEGTLVESYEAGIVLLKLRNGYNFGIKKEDIVSIDLIGKKKEGKKKEARKVNSKLPNVDVIITGGTISSRVDYQTGGVKWLTNPEELFELYPEIFEICNVRKVEIPFMKASENMDYKDWQEIAKICEKSLNDGDCEGVIITHGTDFLHYTAAALSFFLKDLNKPVVLTYSQRSSDRASSDAALNLQCAARVACSDIAEVVLVGHASSNDDFCYALRGSKVRKLHSSRRDAFKPVNTMAIARVFPDRIETITGHRTRDDNKKVKLDDGFNDKIALIKFYPGMDPEIFDFLSTRYHGVVIEVSGLGHLAIDEARKNLLPAIKRAIDNGLIVCAACQTVYGRLDPLVYSPGRKLMNYGIIFLGDMLAETAYVKLGFVLGHRQWKTKEQIREKMLENISGEFNNRLEG